MKNMILITTLFKHKNSIRMEEFKKCITRNAQNPLISKIIIFFERDDTEDSAYDFSYLTDKKILVENIYKKPTFKLFFDYANNYLQGDYIIIANTDIYFDRESGIEKIRQLNPNHLWILTRYNWNLQKGQWELENGGWLYDIEMLGSHDAWCFISPIKNFENSILVGILGCDRYLAQKAAEAHITLVNPSYSIKIKHEHRLNNYYINWNRDYQLYNDFLKFGANSCYPPVSHGEIVLTPRRRKLEIMKYFMNAGPFGKYCRAHYNILKEVGLKKYFQYAYQYRSGQIKKIFCRTGLRKDNDMSLPDGFQKRLQIISKNGINAVLDVGANIGLYAEHLRNVGYKGKILSFEPLSSAYAELVRNAHNDPLWITFPIALGNEDRNAEINISANSYSSSILDMLSSHLESAPDSEYIGEEEIIIRRLDSIFKDICKHDDKLYLKIDTQGYEKCVVEGAEKTLGSVDVLELELSFVPLYKDGPLFHEMLNLLYEKGFVLVHVEPGFTDPSTGQILQVDGIFQRIQRKQ